MMATLTNKQLDRMQRIWDGWYAQMSNHIDRTYGTFAGQIAHSIVKGKYDLATQGIANLRKEAKPPASE